MMNKIATLRQQRFVNEYLISCNATQAAIKSGYSVKCAKEQGHRLLTYVHIQEKIAAANDQCMEKVLLKKEWILQQLMSLADLALQKQDAYDKHGNKIGSYMRNCSVALRALELLGKHLQLF